VDYVFRYSLLRAPQAKNDGSGIVLHDIEAQAAEQGTMNWVIVPSRHKNIQVPAAGLQAVMDMPDSPQSAKVAAYKQAIADSLNTQGVAIQGWGSVQLEALMDANDAAAAAAAEANEYITVTLGLSYPIPFSF